MTPRQTALVGVLGLRIAYGIGLIAAPQRLAGRWLGPASESCPTQVALRALGAREVALHGGALAASFSHAPVRPWLLASIGGDLTDVVATFLARRQLPQGSAPATLAVGGGSALLTAGLAATVDR